MLTSKKLWLGLLVSAVFLALFLYGIDFPDTGAALKNANYLYVVPAVAVYFGSLVFRALRWQYILRNLRLIPLSRLYAATVVGYMANNVLPVRLGEVAKAYYLGQREKVSVTSALATVGIERIYDGVTLIFVLLVIWPFLPLGDLLKNDEQDIVMTVKVGDTITFERLSSSSDRSTVEHTFTILELGIDERFQPGDRIEPYELLLDQVGTFTITDSANPTQQGTVTLVVEAVTEAPITYKVERFALEDTRFELRVGSEAKWGYEAGSRIKSDEGDLLLWRVAGSAGLVGVFFGAIIVLVAAAVSPQLGRRLIAILVFFVPDRFKDQVRNLAELFIGGLESLNSPKKLLAILVLSIPIWIMESLMYYLITFSFDLDVPFSLALAVTATSNLVGAIPAAPGNVGTFEWATKVTLVSFGHKAEASVAYAATLHMSLWLPVVIAGLIYLWTQHRSLMDLTRSRPAAVGAHGDPVGQASLERKGEE